MQYLLHKELDVLFGYLINRSFIDKTGDWLTFSSWQRHLCIDNSNLWLGSSFSLHTRCTWGPVSYQVTTSFPASALKVTLVCIGLLEMTLFANHPKFPINCEKYFKDTDVLFLATISNLKNSPNSLK